MAEAVHTARTGDELAASGEGRRLRADRGPSEGQSGRTVAARERGECGWCARTAAQPGRTSEQRAGEVGMTVWIVRAAWEGKR